MNKAKNKRWHTRWKWRNV